jgi:hypothetical protein
MQILVDQSTPYQLLGSRSLYEAPPVQYLIEGLFPLNSVIGLTGFPGTGKTWYAMEAMRTVATRKNFLGKFPTKQAPVLFVGADSSYLDYARQWRRLTQGDWEDYQDDIEAGEIHENPLDTMVNFMFTDEQTFNFDEPDLIARLIATSRQVIRPQVIGSYQSEEGDTEEEHYGLIVFDCLSKLTAAPENDNSANQQVFRNVRQIAEATGATILLLHHNTSPNEYSDGKGWRGGGKSGAAVQSLDAHLHLTKRSLDTVQFEACKFRGLTPDPFVFKLDVHTEEVAELLWTDEKAGTVEEVESSLIEDMVTVIKGQGSPATLDEIADALAKMPGYQGFEKDTSVRRFLDNRIKTICGMPKPKIVRLAARRGKRVLYFLSPEVPRE